MNNLFKGLDSSSEYEDSSDCDNNMNLNKDCLYQKTPILSQLNGGEDSLAS